jgi:hypothetical protein
MEELNKTNKEEWTIFSDQSKFFWGFQQTTAIVQVGIFSAWFTLFSRTQPMKFLACGTLIFGITILFILFLIIRRASQYLEKLRPHGIKVPKPLFGLSTSILGRMIPLILVIFNLLLIIYTIFN